MDKFLIILAAFVGGFISALLGYFDSGEPFDVKKFGKSVIVCLVNAIIWAVKSYVASGDLATDMAMAFSSSITLDVLYNRATGAYNQLKKNKE
ncbi:MAG: hypothetical protein PHN44_01155 [Candidatus Marinimicrobia bacterium]|nr:hypothetical protein [Candidatus Neomarinimicrobiota bacterium]MDD5539099.1 hypothetical protein [Candidatus Neomarinimicrobiota bacterium]